MTANSANEFVRRIIKSGHESVLEHEKVSVRVVCDRGVSHEIVRHRIAAYSQESTRYCDYGKGGVVVVDMDGHLDHRAYAVWLKAMEDAEKVYLRLRGMGVTPQFARSVLPNSLKTEIVVTYDLRQWRHFLKLRTAKAAHPQMREVAGMILDMMKALLPVVFEDIPGEGSGT
jgi:thymidylate synthase (FAD)